MTEPHSGRLTQLLQLLEKEPNDGFLLFGLGIEYKNLNEANTALGYFDRVIALNPDHAYAYFQQGQILESAGDADQARSKYRAGIEAAKRGADEKARGELESALDMLD